MHNNAFNFLLTAHTLLLFTTFIVKYQIGSKSRSSQWNFRWLLPPILGYTRKHVCIQYNCILCSLESVCECYLNKHTCILQNKTMSSNIMPIWCWIVLFWKDVWIEWMELWLIFVIDGRARSGGNGDDHYYWYNGKVGLCSSNNCTNGFCIKTFVSILYPISVTFRSLFLVPVPPMCPLSRKWRTKAERQCMHVGLEL